MTSMVALRIQDIQKSFNGAPLLRNLSLEIARGEIACLLGPSGSGKTTLLRIIAGLEQAESGAIIFDERDMRDVPVHQRGFGLMFQDLALFPHRDVFQNVAFGLRMHASRLDHDEITARVNELLELVGLGNLGTRDVNQLSGGEQQRIALARALAPRPRLLMFDEPLGALDRILREQLVRDLRTILKQMQMTALYVTHDQTEAFAIADRVCIIHEGQIAQSGTPREVYENPADVFVARFLGMENLLRGRLISSSGTEARVETDEGVFVADAQDPKEIAKNSEQIVVLIKPDAVEEIATEPWAGRENAVEGVIVEARFIARQTRVVVQTRRGARLVFDWRTPIEPGTRVSVTLNRRGIIFLRE